MKLLNEFLILIIKATRPFFGPYGSCRYYFSCTDYAILQLREKNIIGAIYSSFKRVISCNPLIKFK